MPSERSIIDAASGGALVDKTPEAARQLISNMAANSKQFGTRGDFSNKRVNEVSVSNLENKVNDLTSLVRSLACGNVQQVKVCSICSLQGHASDMCPTMQEDYIEHANTVDGAFNGQPQRKYDPFSTTYNPGWRDHPNLRYGNVSTKQSRPTIPFPWISIPTELSSKTTPSSIHKLQCYGGRHPLMIFVR